VRSASNRFPCRGNRHSAPTMLAGAARLYFPGKCCQLPKRFGIDLASTLHCYINANFAHALRIPVERLRSSLRIPTTTFCAIGHQMIKC
jgi:hypothetical protein